VRERGTALPLPAAGAGSCAPSPSRVLLFLLLSSPPSPGPAIVSPESGHRAQRFGAGTYCTAAPGPRVGQTLYAGARRFVAGAHCAPRAALWGRRALRCGAGSPRRADNCTLERGASVPVRTAVKHQRASQGRQSIVRAESGHHARAAAECVLAWPRSSEAAQLKCGAHSLRNAGYSYGSGSTLHSGYLSECHFQDSMIKSGSIRPSIALSLTEVWA
jgi:hypothetical protein